MTTANSFTRRDVSFNSGEDYCSAWLYLPDGVESPPVVILGHGLGGTREMGLDAYAERFAAAGIAALAFTYRHFGDSSGEPRQLLSIKRQLQDWDAAIAHVKTRGDSTARDWPSGGAHSAGAMRSPSRRATPNLLRRWPNARSPTAWRQWARSDRLSRRASWLLPAKTPWP